MQMNIIMQRLMNGEKYEKSMKKILTKYIGGGVTCS
jgi:hypothetical protein